MMLSLPLVATLATLGVAVDRWLGEPRTAHPLVGFGNWAMRLEKRYNTGRRLRLKGLLAWSLAVLPPVLFAWCLVAVLPFFAACAVHIVLLWFALGARSLHDHLAPIALALKQRDLAQARLLTARIVSRDTTNSDEAALSRAAVESALENGNDAIFGALFWFAIAGGPGALGFRLANTTLLALWLGRRASRRRTQLDPRAPNRHELCAARRHAHRVALLARTGTALGQPQCRAGDGRGRGQSECADRRAGGLSRCA
jgi:adenosylcobinamide-phosphate synthase